MMPRWVRVASDKRPIQTNGRNASVTARGTWTTYQDAAASTVGTGPGFVLAGDGIVCVDLDHAVSGGRVAPWARELLAMCPDTYVEVSRSGTGLHVWGYGMVGVGRRIRDGAVCVEVYGRERYIALGTRRRGAPLRLAPITALLDRFTSAYAAAAAGL